MSWRVITLHENTDLDREFEITDWMTARDTILEIMKMVGSHRFSPVQMDELNKGRPCVFWYEWNGEINCISLEKGNSK